MNIRKAVTIFTGFVHDFGTGYWLACVVVIRLLHGLRIADTTIATALNHVQRMLFWHLVAAIVVVFATGAGRKFTYVENFYGQESEQTRRRMLIRKHVILLTIFTIGSYIAYRLTFIL